MKKGLIYWSIRIEWLRARHSWTSCESARENVGLSVCVSILLFLALPHSDRTKRTEENVAALLLLQTKTTRKMISGEGKRKSREREAEEEGTRREDEDEGDTDTAAPLAWQ